MSRIKRIKPETQFFPKRIMEKMDCIKHYPLILVEAPSGFGKTTALRHFFDTQVSKDTSVYWYAFSVDRPSVSWKAFCGLIEGFDPESAKSLWEAGAPDEDTLPVIKNILRKLRCSHETYLVIDDFALWNLPVFGEFLTALSSHGGKELHVIVATQLLPQEDQIKMMENSNFSMLRESVLAFTKDEIEAYYRQAGVSMSRVQLEEVFEITEGWVMALYLQMLNFIERGKFETGSMDSLIGKALWDKLPQSERDLLLSISIFPRFSLSQAAALSEMSKTDTEKLLRGRRVFVRFDKESRQFYLHSLFQKFLREQFALLPEIKQKEIYLAGGNLADQSGDRLSTLKFYYLSGAWENILSKPLTSYEIADIVDENTKPMILDILEHTPLEIKRKYPAAIVPLAFTLFFLHENQKLLSMQEEIKEIIEQSQLPQERKDAFQGEMELLLSFLEYNRIDAMSARHKRALELLKGPAILISIKSTWTFGSPSVLYMFYRESGKLEEELAQMDECMPVYYALTEGHGSGAEIMMRAEAHFIRGELDESEILCHNGMLTADRKRQNSIYQCGLFLLARIAILRKDKELLQNAIKSMEERSKQNTEDLCRYTLDLARGYLDLLLGNKENIPSWIETGDINDKRLVIMTQPFAYIIYGRILLERGEYLKLIGICQYFLGISSIFPNLLPQIYGNIYLAKALHGTGKSDEAASALEKALTIALPDRVFMPFAENWEEIKGLLLVADSILTKEAIKNIERLAQMLKESIDSISTPRFVLTPREKEIVELIKLGLSNKEIAAALYISLSTVKTLLSRIYEKTGVSSKTQLVMLDL